MPVIQVDLFKIAFVPVEVKKIGKGAAKSIFHKPPVLGSDVTIVSAEYDNRGRIRIVLSEGFDLLFELLIKLPGKQNALPITPCDQPRIVPEFRALKVLDTS